MTTMSGRALLASAVASVVVGLATLAPLAGVPASAAPASAAPTSAPAVALFSFADPRIGESSGLAVSSRTAGIVFTHNDSGDSARFFAVDEHGRTVAVYTLPGATNVDWEDMASGHDAQGRPVLYLADIGDNDRKRTEIVVYQVPEPVGPSADVAWLRYRFSYPDGAHDAETLLVDPAGGRIYIATKSLLGQGELYEAPQAPSTSQVNTLTPVRPVPALTTSGDFSPDGRRIVLLTYLRAYWADGVTGVLHSFDVPAQRQDEAIAFTRDGTAVLVGSEGEHSLVYRVPLPPGPGGASSSAVSSPLSAIGSPSAPVASATAAETGRGSPSSRLAVTLAAVGGGLVVAAAVFFLVVRRRGPGKQRALGTRRLPR